MLSMARKTRNFPFPILPCLSKYIIITNLLSIEGKLGAKFTLLEGQIYNFFPQLTTL